MRVYKTRITDIPDELGKSISKPPIIACYIATIFVLFRIILNLLTKSIAFSETLFSIWVYIATTVVLSFSILSGFPTRPRGIISYKRIDWSKWEKGGKASFIINYTVNSVAVFATAVLIPLDFISGLISGENLDVNPEFMYALIFVAIVSLLIAFEHWNRRFVGSPTLFDRFMDNFIRRPK